MYKNNVHMYTKRLCTHVHFKDNVHLVSTHFINICHALLFDFQKTTSFPVMYTNAIRIYTYFIFKKGQNTMFYLKITTNYILTCM